ncbi:flagellar protein FlgJ [Halanaerobium congolense]|uniref:Flagellar protein FlgJ n=1 Tax=Halanaerobium congolense TaxID=54121 RepID=A0A1G6RIF0_9FIRM|nr:rod-binding protein [Halanaerobium congolense]KXS49936.1 MAG: flagellar protein FlgJ [Halanaerobium sp. T82-1]PUU92291.1 MAG: hypothetical protein CI948_723 [Halanaerobium sp.]TDS34703.1 flagellar protein FlgJ [Halanaerobium congolense]TDX42368.1 flagellar protein FlgJ [Halanaerobium congolense]SDD04124.1 flagellar protein FlgJ [Halanaerobium congolense]
MIEFNFNTLNQNQFNYQMDLQKEKHSQNNLLKMRNKIKNEANKTGKASNNSAEMERLEKEAEKFTAIFVEKMFSEMKSTLSEDKLLDGGYAEDIFSDMLTKEYSQMAGKQGLLAELNKKLVAQLRSFK